MSFGKIVVAGSRGRMGAMLLERLRKAGMEAEGTDQPFEPDRLRTVCKQAKWVILCIPSRYIAEVTRAFATVLPQNAVIADIASVKMLPMQAMLREWSGSVVGTHPLFGPDTDGVLPVALVPGRGDHAADLLEDLLQNGLGWKVFRTTAQKHDEAVAKIQWLNFMAGTAYFSMLAEDETLMPFLTPSFKRAFAASRRLLVDDGPLFTEMFSENPYHEKVLCHFREALNITDMEAVSEMSRKVRWWDRQLSECNRG
ncbi:MAG: prephenate dehydrogenase/arogenate dehydrogenase family protein [Desulfovibrionaceae bacterium]|nr:prephenate dehydrogenase/arogenate dehydrogenase family protein [Desulfovibrionaceae bacterium]